MFRAHPFPENFAPATLAGLAVCANVTKTTIKKG
jgi:hypothetical protein